MPLGHFFGFLPVDTNKSLEIPGKKISEIKISRVHFSKKLNCRVYGSMPLAHFFCIFGFGLARKRKEKNGNKQVQRRSGQGRIWQNSRERAAQGRSGQGKVNHGRAGQDRRSGVR